MRLMHVLMTPRPHQEEAGEAREVGKDLPPLPLTPLCEFRCCAGTIIRPFRTTSFAERGQDVVECKRTGSTL
jgi:hypothetical protein